MKGMPEEERQMMIAITRTVNEIYAEWQRARSLFPGNRHMLAALLEEVGELSQALMEHDRGEITPKEVYEEAIQVATMAIRIALEGDASFRYAYADIKAFQVEETKTPSVTQA